MTLKFSSLHIKLKKYYLVAFTFFYSLLSILLHVEVSKLVTGKYDNITGDFNAREYSVEFSFIVLLIVIVYLIKKFVAGERRLTTLFYWFLYAIILFLFYFFISLHQVETIHIVQYTSIAYLI